MSSHKYIGAMKAFRSTATIRKSSAFATVSQNVLGQKQNESTKRKTTEKPRNGGSMFSARPVYQVDVNSHDEREKKLPSKSQ